LYSETKAEAERRVLAANAAEMHAHVRVEVPNAAVHVENSPTPFAR
jgi:hypothetical protein